MFTLEEDDTGEEEVKFLHFQSGAGERLLDLNLIVEVLPMVALEYFEESTSPYFLGGLRYRGEFVPVFSLKAGLQSEKNPDYFLIVLAYENRKLALLAQNVMEVLSLRPDCIEKLPIGASSSVVIVKVKDSYLRVCEPAHFFTADASQVWTELL